MKLAELIMLAKSANIRSTLPIMQKQYQGKNEVVLYAENGGYPPTQNGDIRSLFLFLSLPQAPPY
mgnify:CR=1 FL=1